MQTVTERYYDWIAQNKIDIVHSDGFVVDRDSLPETLTAPNGSEHQKDMVVWAAARGRGLIAASFGLGKCHGAGTPILMADGSIKAVQAVRVGDQLMGDDGTPRNVLALGRGRDEMYRVTLKNGDSYTCNQAHIMSLQVSNKYGPHRFGDVVDMSIDEFFDLPDYARRNSFKHYKVAVDFPDQPVPFDPYLYGAWLGDGHRREFAYTINDLDTAIVDRIQTFAQERQLVVRELPSSGCTTYFLTRQVKGRAPHCPEFYFTKGSSDQDGKHIDMRYLRNSRQVRLELLAGLLDTDGHLVDGCFEIATKWEGLRDDILYLARSLGLSVSYGPKVVNGDTYHRIWISGDTDMVPCVTRKKAAPRRQIKRPLVYGFTVDPIGQGDYYGFEIDGNHRYLLGDFTVTHNTRVQIQLLKEAAARHPGKQVMIIAPLGVRHQFTEEDGPAMGVHFRYVRTDAEAAEAGTYLITNYERPRDGDISADYIRQNIIAVSLDEGNVLRSLGSITQQTFLQIFQPVRYRWAATATPDPNHYREMIYYADFFGIADHGQILTRWFKRDSQKAGNLTIHPHHEKDFWMWVASWALFLRKPSDLGYSDDGYELTPLEVVWHRVASDHEKAWVEHDSWGQHYLFRDSAASITQAIREKRDTIDTRVAMAKEIVEAGDPGQHYIVWHHLEAERHAVCRAIPEAVDVYGSQPIDQREQRIMDFTHGQFRILATKPEIAGSGCNFQHYCHTAIYLGVRYQFDEFIQSVHRLHRFLQKQPVTIHIIYSDAEDQVVQVMKRKWAQHEAQVERMAKIVQEFGLTTEAMAMTLKRTLGTNRTQVDGTFYTLVNNDCVVELDGMEADSVDMILTSIPFSKHYEYTAQREDFGYNGSNELFFEQMAFLVPNLLRVLKPGRIAAIHVKDLIEYGHLTGLGFPTLYEFSDDTVRAFKSGGFAFTGRITVTTDVVRENNTTYRLGWSENAKDGTKMGVGVPEYLLLFRKPPTDNSRSYADDPVAKPKSDYTRQQWQIDAHAYWRSDGNRLARPEEIAELNPDDMLGYETGTIYRWYQEFSKRNIYDYQKHVAMGVPLEENGRLPATFGLFLPQAPDFAADNIWTDIIPMRTLNSEQAWRKIEAHVCPLPFDIVDRAIVRYSNAGDLILDPFSGLGTTAYRAVALKRRGYGIELSQEYFGYSCAYLREIEASRLAPTLFDLEAFTSGNGATVAQTQHDRALEEYLAEVAA